VLAHFVADAARDVGDQQVGGVVGPLQLGRPWGRAGAEPLEDGRAGRGPRVGLSKVCKTLSDNEESRP